MILLLKEGTTMALLLQGVFCCDGETLSNIFRLFQLSTKMIEVGEFGIRRPSPAIKGRFAIRGEEITYMGALVAGGRTAKVVDPEKPITHA